MKYSASAGKNVSEHDILNRISQLEDFLWKPLPIQSPRTLNCRKSNERLLPENLNPINLKVFIYNSFGLDSLCELDQVIRSLIRLLEWHENKTVHPYELFSEKGVFWMLTGILNTLGLSDYGVSPQRPWLTTEGKLFLTALKTYTIEEIEDAKGEAYDGFYYE